MGVSIDYLTGKVLMHEHEAGDVYLSNGISVEEAISQGILPDTWKGGVLEIKSIKSGDIDDGDDIGNRISGYVYEYDSSSSGIDDVGLLGEYATVIQPIDGPVLGRWIKKIVLVDTLLSQQIYNKVLDGTNVLNAKDVDLLLSDVTDNNVDVTRHGFCPKLSNVASQYLNGQGVWSTPSGLTLVNSYAEVTVPAGSTSYTYVHMWGARPVVQCVDSGTGEVFIPNRIVHDNINQTTVYFSRALERECYIQYTLGGPQAQRLTIAPGDYTILLTDRIVQVTGIGSVIKLPSAVGSEGYEWIIDNNSGGNITVEPLVLGQTIEGLPSQVVGNNNAIVVYSDGTNFRIW